MPLPHPIPWLYFGHSDQRWSKRRDREIEIFSFLKDKGGWTKETLPQREDRNLRVVAAQLLGRKGGQSSVRPSYPAFQVVSVGQQ